MFEDVHDPDADDDYELDWSEWLAGDTVVASDWIVPAPLVRESQSFTATTAKVRVSGGVHRARYTITNRITTANGRVQDRSISLDCKHK